MNKKQAETLVDELTRLLTGRELITAESTPLGLRIRQGQTFNTAYFVQYNDGGCVVAISDSYGVMGGSDRWTIEPNLRQVRCETLNDYGEPCRFSWAIAGEDGDGKVYNEMIQVQNRLWKVEA